MKRLRRGSGIFDAMLARAGHVNKTIFWSSPDTSAKNQADLDAQKARDEQKQREEDGQ